jgi:LuxR family maltose regulon positive regulatory protein
MFNPFIANILPTMYSIDRLQSQFRILPSKINRPPLPKGHIAREQLVARLNLAQSKRCISVLAPAGFGKSTLLAEWASQPGQSTLWYSLDELDNDLSRFCSYLFVAVRKAFPQVHSQFFENEKNLIAENQSRIVRHLVQLLAAIPEPSALVLDDCQTITNPVIWQIIELTLAQLPGHLCLILGSRTRSPIGITRLRSSNQIQQFNILDIKFSQTDTERFLTLNLPQYSLEQSQKLVSKEMSGWVAGLQLCLISHNQYGAGSVPESGESQKSQRLIQDYLIEEVLKNTDEQTLEFLFATVICRRFSVELANELTAGRNADLIIDKLQREQLFILPEGTAEPWYRYHSMFRHSLLAIVTKKNPQAIDPLHLKAAHWWVTREYYAEAAEHILASGSLSALQQFLTQYGWLLYRSGKLLTLGQCFEQLPRATVLQDTPLAILLCWTLLHDYQLVLAQQSLVQAKTNAQGPVSKSIRCAVYTLEALLAQSLGEPLRALDLAQSALTMASHEMSWDRSHALLVIAQARQDLGQFSHSIQSAEQAIRLGTAHQFQTQTAQAYYLLASAYMAIGNNSDAAESLDQALDIAANGGLSSLFASEALCIAQTQLLSSAAQYDSALALLDQDNSSASMSVSTWQLPLQTARLQLLLSSNADRGRLNDAATKLSAMRTADCTKTDWRLAADQALLLWRALANSASVAGGSGGPMVGPWDVNVSLEGCVAPLIALLLKDAIPVSLPGEICNLIEHHDDTKGSPTGLKIRLLLAVCYRRLGQPNAAKLALLEALEWSSAAPNIGLVECYKNSLGLPLLEPGDLLDPAAAQWLFLFRPNQSELNDQQLTLRTALLTNKEWAVVTLLADQLTNDQIATLLGIQANTVRSHLKNINRKLRVTGRTQAIAQAKVALRMRKLE